MPTLAAFLLATLAPPPIDLDGISIDRARHLHGRLVVASFISVKPPDLWQDRQGQDWTIIGAADPATRCCRCRLVVHPGPGVGRREAGEAVVRSD